MTLTVGKNALTIPWPYVLTALIAIVGTSVTATYKCVTFMDKMESRFDKIDAKLAAIQKSDTAYFHKTDLLSTDMDNVKPVVSTLKTDVNALKEAAIYQHYRFVTERRGSNGHIYTKPVNN